MLRTAVDWANLLYDHPVRSWPSLVMAETITLQTPGESIVLVRQGKPDATATRAVWKGEAGVWVQMHSPETASRIHGRYPVSVSVQGLACSSSADGLAAVDAIRRALERELWGDEDVQAHLQPGKVDIATDVEVGGDVDDASEWIEREVFCHAHLDRFASRFATRARAKGRTVAGARMLGSQTAGRTGQLGTDPRMIVYEKDRNSGDRNGRDLPLVMERWREAGWDGHARVIRIEVRVSRDWLADNDVRRGNETHRLAGPAGLPFVSFVEWIPSIARELLSRFRMTDPTDTATRIHRRASSPLWRVAGEAIDRWEEALAREHGVVPEDWGAGKVMSRARERTRARVEKAAENALADLTTLVHAQTPEASIGDVAAMVATRVRDGHGASSAEAVEKRRELLARRNGLALSPHGLRGKVRDRIVAPTTERDAILALLAETMERYEGTNTATVLDMLVRTIEHGHHRRE